MRRKFPTLVGATLLALLVLLTVNGAFAQVPVGVWGYVYMPDGSPAAGASVVVSGGGDTVTTTTGSDGKYVVTLTVSSVPVTVTVRASKDGYSGSATATGEGTIRIDVRLSPPPPPPPPPPPSKKPTSLTITVSKAEYVNESVMISGSISPAMSTQITLVIIKPDGSTIQVSVKSDSQGRFSYEFLPDVPGMYQVYAKFAETSEYQASTSSTLRFYFKLKPAISFKAEPVGPGQVVVRGSVSPAPETGTVVMVYISLDGGKTWLPFCNATTGKDGSFAVNVSVSISGELMFKAVLLGTETLTRAESAASGVKLVSTEEETLRSELERINKENQLLKANISSLVVRLKETEESLRETEAKLSETTSALEKANETAQLYRSEASLYKTVAAVGIPALFAAGIAVGAILVPKIRRKG